MRFTRYALLPLLSVLLCLSGISGALAKVLRTTSIPSSVISNPQELLNAVMKEFYGTFDQTKKCWITKRNDQTYCMKPYKVDTVRSDRARSLFIVIAGQTLDEDGTPQEYHAASGVLGLIVLLENGPQLDVVATNTLYEDFGSFGKVPAVNSFTVRELGPNGSYGWVIGEQEFGTGEEVDFNFLYAVIGDTITSIGTIVSRELRENDCGRRCTNYSIELLIDQTAQNSQFYPLVLRASGVKDGRPFNKTYRVRFDTSSFKYLVPREID